MFAAQSRTSQQAKAKPKPGPAKTLVGYTQPNQLWQQLATRVQPKLAVNAPDDPCEREAGRVADRVMRMPQPKVQRSCAACSAGGLQVPLSPQPEERPSTRIMRWQPPRATFVESVDPRLPRSTPAWTEDGHVRLSPYGLFLAPARLPAILRHEAVHAAQQRIAPQQEGASARVYAESLASRAEQNEAAVSFRDFLAPAPHLLAYPPQTYKPWTQVTIGHPGIVGEVVDAGVTVRIFKRYDDLGVKGSGAGYQNYECGKHDAPPIPDLAKKMHQVAQLTAKFNESIPKEQTTLRVALVTVFGDKSGNAYRMANGKGLIVLSEDDFNAGTFPATLSHEASHAVFEFHSVAKGAEGRKPDPLALRVADLYVRLKATKAVPDPTAKFDLKDPPPLQASSTQAANHPAGLLMVMDTLWAGEGGHPWQGVDEFFASAYGGYQHDPALLKKIVAYYERADSKIKDLAKELFALLDVAGDPKKAAKLKEPAKPEAAIEQLALVSPMLDETNNATGLGWLIDPTRMPGPSTIPCLPPKPVTDPTIEELLKP